MINAASVETIYLTTVQMWETCHAIDSFKIVETGETNMRSNRRSTWKT